MTEGKQYYVYGEGIRFVSGPHPYDEAVSIWTNMSWKHVDDCEIRFIITDELNVEVRNVE